MNDPDKIPEPFSEMENNPPEGMKSIRFRGGIVRFCLPATWEEEYDANARGATFHDKLGVGSLRLSVLEVPTRQPMQPGLAATLLQPMARRTGQVPILPLDDDTALIIYRDEGGDGEDTVIARCWVLARTFPPQHARIALFTFTYAPEEEGDPELDGILEMLDRELRQCRFAAEVGP
jgi:hypothetical protein